MHYIIQILSYFIWPLPKTKFVNKIDIRFKRIVFLSVIFVSDYCYKYKCFIVVKTQAYKVNDYTCHLGGDQFVLFSQN